MLSWRRLERSDWDHKLVFTMFTEVINQVRSRVIFSVTSIQTDFPLQPEESPPAGHEKECMFSALLHELHFSKLEVAAWYLVTNVIWRDNRWKAWGSNTHNLNSIVRVSVPKCHWKTLECLQSVEFILRGISISITLQNPMSTRWFSRYRSGGPTDKGKLSSTESCH